MARSDEPAGYAAGLNFIGDGSYAPQPGYAVPLEFNPSVDPPGDTQYLFPQPLSSLAMGAAAIGLRFQYIAPGGFVNTTYGTATVINRDKTVLPGGIASTNVWSTPTIWFRNRPVYPAPIFAFLPNNNHLVTHYVQFLTSIGIAPGSVGFLEIKNRNATVAPEGFNSNVFGTQRVFRQFFVNPAGWDSSFISQNAELLINTRRIYAHSGEADPAEYGDHNVKNYNTLVSVQGWTSDQIAFPVIYNLNRSITVGPYSENIDPTGWTNFYPYVENYDRYVTTFGAQSSRFALTNWIHNAAEPVKPVGFDATLWGTTRVEHKIRNVYPQGWDSFYNTQYSVVYNAAVAIKPVSLGGTSRFGTPNPVANLNRTIKYVGFTQDAYGIPFIAFRVRNVYPNLFYDVPASFPEVRHNPYPIVPVGIPVQGQVGGHEVVTRKLGFSPFSVNVHSTPWVGEPFIRNRNLTIPAEGTNLALYGRPTIQLYIRYIVPAGVEPGGYGSTLIEFRTKNVNPAPITVPAITVLHKIKNDAPDPPSTQRIVLDIADPDGLPLGGFGIAPPGMPFPAFKLQTLYPVGLATPAVFGSHKVHSNNIQPQFIFEDGLFGVPILIYDRYLRPSGIQSEITVPQPQMSPWNIYGPAGDQAPPNYHPLPNEVGRPMDWVLYSFDGSRWPCFGQTTVSTLHRAIGPVPSRDGGLEGNTRFGTSTWTLRRQIVYPSPIRSLRFGSITFPFQPQYVDLDAEFQHAGIAPSQQWGANVIAYPPDPPDVTRTMYPVGTVMTGYGTHRVELFNRTIEVPGIPHAGGSSGTNPWGDALVGYPRRYEIGMGVQTLWGTLVIEYKNRHAYPAGWNSLSLQSGGFDDFRFPMKVTRTNPKVTAVGIPPKQFWGAPTVTHYQQGVLSRGIDSYTSGQVVVSAAKTVAPSGWDSLVVGNIDRWEAGKVKPHGDDLSTIGQARILRPFTAGGMFDGAVGAPRVGNVLAPLPIPAIAFAGPVVTNPFGCTNRAISPLPILSGQVVPAPVVHR